MKSIRHLFVLAIAVMLIAVVGGAFATFVYPVKPPEDIDGEVNVSLGMFEYYEGTGDMNMAEEIVADRFVKEMTTMLTNANNTRLDEVIEARKSSGSFWLQPKEFAADDPAGESRELREILGLEEYPELTVIIKFVSGSPGYELFTTRVDVDAKDENGNYIIPEEEFSNETTFIYPVNRTTFKSDGKGGYVVDKVTVGYSRAIYYYETATTQNTTRTYDVSTWAEGNSTSTAVPMETEIIGEEITVQNIDKQKEAYFGFSVGGWGGASTGKYKFTTSVQGLTATILNSSGRNVTNSNLSNGNYYLKLSYSTEGEPEDFKFTFST
ncbi:MAG: hypothetical protein IJA97_01940 [Clostridia bacterium]|nr:hypothetical protein [Clostridia bacterium]